jgi:hypothetical protein
MDFPSRDEARVYARLQAKEASKERAEQDPASSTVAAPGSEMSPEARAAEKRFSVERKGFEGDVYDRRGMRDLIRTGEIVESDRVRIDDGEPTAAREVSDLKALFDLKKKSTVTPPLRCRSHTDRMAHFVCPETERPLCDECAQEKKFGGTSIRVCAHCGGPAREMVAPS